MACPHKAVLIVTRSVRGTSSSLARERVELSCAEAEGHQGEHRDPRHNRSWKDRGQTVTHVIVNEDE